MKRKKSKGLPLFQRARWRVEDALYAGLELALTSVTSPTAYHLGEVLGALAWRFAPRFRRTILRNLRVAFAGEKDPAELHALAHEVMLRAGGNLLSSIRTAAIPAQKVPALVDVVDQHLFSEALAAGKGVILVLPHMGNWEALAQVGPEVSAPWPGATHYRPLNNPYLDARISARRGRTGMTLFSKKASALAMTSFLRQGGAIGILGDQRVGKAGEVVPFFGRATSCTPLPALLTKRTGARALALSMSTSAPGRWAMRFHPVSEPYDTANCMAAMEQAMRTSPADVFWLQDRWMRAMDSSLQVIGKSTGEVEENKPHRALHITEEGYTLFKGSQPEPIPIRMPEWNAGAASWIRALEQLDEADPLPLDAVICPCKASSSLRKACRMIDLPLGVAGGKPK